MRDTIKDRIAQVRRGEVPVAYTRTRAGIMPTEWIDGVPKRAADVFRSNTNKNHGGMYEILSATQDRGIIPRSEVDIDIKYAEESIAGYKKVDRGDFVISLRSFQGGIEYSEYEGLVSPAYTILKPIKQISDGYYKEYFKTKDFISRLNGAVYGIRDGKQIGYEDFGDLVLHYPPIAEQQKIAEILAQCDKVIALKQELLEEKRKQKKWLMQRLLTGKTRLNGYTGKWKSANMQKLFLFGGALAASREQLGDEGLCYLHYGDIHANDTFEIDVKREYEKIPKLQCNKVQDRYLLKDGDVAFVDASEDYLGASKYVVIKNPDNIPFISGLHTMPIREKGDELLTEYKRYCFQSEPFVRQVAFYVSGMKILGVSKDNLGKIVLKYPLKEEQTAISKVLSTADKGIDLLEQELAAWKEKKKGLAQLLLTGLVRV